MEWSLLKCKSGAISKIPHCFCYLCSAHCLTTFCFLPFQLDAARTDEEASTSADAQPTSDAEPRTRGREAQAVSNTSTRGRRREVHAATMRGETTVRGRVTPPVDIQPANDVEPRARGRTREAQAVSNTTTRGQEERGSSSHYARRDHY